MKADVLNIEGASTGRSVELSEKVFNEEPNDHAVYLCVKSLQANRRQGTHSSKERNAVVGSTRKIKKQKGTGTARAGDIKNPIFRGGGRIFGPRPKDYKVKVNRKVSQLARRSVLSAILKSENLIVVEDFSFDQPKTKKYIEVLGNLGVAEGQKSLLVTSESEKEVFISSRNLPYAEVLSVDRLSLLDMMKSDKLILSEGAAERLNEILG